MSTDVTHSYPERTPNGSPYSQRQMRIIDLLSKGLTQKEIADAMNENFSSFRRHLLQIRAEVFALSNEHLIAICYQRGWLPR